MLENHGSVWGLANVESCGQLLLADADALCNCWCLQPGSETSFIEPPQKMSPDYPAAATHLAQVLQVLVARLLQLVQCLEHHVGPNGVRQYEGG